MHREEDQLAPESAYTLATWLAGGPLDAHETVRLGARLLEALGTLHAGGRVHGDLRPRRITLERGDGAPSVTIEIDAARATPAPKEEVARYVAPEAAGLVDRRVDGRSDLYSLGVILYECLAGAPPFAGETLGETLRQHLHVRPPSLWNPDGRVPRALDDAIARLIEKEQADRYQTAAGALADLVTLDAALALGDPEPVLVVGRRDRRGTLAAPGFVAREAELGFVEAELERARRGAGRTCLIESESGGGKSRLLDEIARRAARLGALVLRGRAVEDRLSAPFELFAAVARGIDAAAGEDARFAEALATRLGSTRATLGLMFPELAPRLGMETATGRDGPEAFSDHRVEEALGSLFAALAMQIRPVVVLLDDAQWSPDVARVLPRLLEQHEQRARPNHLMLAVAFRAEEVAREHPLRHAVARPSLRLAPLEEEALGALAESMAGPLPAEAVRLVAELSAGNPFFAVATLHGLVESRALVFADGGWRVDPRGLTEVQSGSAADALVRRIGRLPASVLRLLEVGAVLGHQASGQASARASSGLDLELAAAVLGVDEREVRAAAAEARARHLVWAPEPGVFAFSHHKLRQAFVERLAPEARGELHRKAAEHLARARPDEVFLIAYHFDAAGDAERAAPFALSAAGRARARHAFRLAEACYRIAERGTAVSDVATRAGLARLIGEVTTLTGRSADALLELERALALAPRDDDKAQAYALMGEAYYRQGDFAEVSRVGEAGLALIAGGGKPPRGDLHYTLSVVGKVLVQAWHSYFPKLVRRRGHEDATEARMAMRLYSSLVFANFLVKSPISAFWAHLSELNLAERYAPTPELARAYLNHGVALGQIPWRARAYRYFERAYATADAVGDPAIAGAVDTYHAMVLSWGGAQQQALELGARGRATLLRIGDRFGACATNGPTVFALYRLGRIEETLARCTSYLREGIDADDGSAIGSAVLVWSLAAAGHVPRRHLEEARKRCVEAYPRTLLLGAEGRARLAHGEVDEAARVFEEALMLIGKQRNGIVADIPLWLATVRRIQAERLPPFHPARPGALEVAEACLRRCRMWTKICVGMLPHYEREAAHLSALRGHSRRAKKHLAASLAAAEAQHAQHERARTREAEGVIARALGWPDAPPEPRRRASAAAATLSLVDRFDNILQAGRGIALALTRERVLEAVRDAVMKLLRARSCRVVEPGAGEAAMSASAGTLRFPLWANGEAQVVIEVDSGAVEGLFGEDEERLATFIAALGGAALENAAGFEKLVAAEREIRELSSGVMRAQEEERRRLALALHDGSSQALTAALLQLEALGHEQSAPVAKLLHGALEDLRRLSHALRPAALDNLGLAAALRELVASLDGERLTVELQIEPPDLAIPNEVALHAFRIAQAALSNAVQHAHARNVSVSFVKDQGFAVLEVHDDGVGFERRAPRSGLGLLGMQERATGLGGDFTVTTRPGAGTKVRARLPLEGA